MNLYVTRDRLKSILILTRLLSVVLWLRRSIMVLISPAFRFRERACREEFLQFEYQYGKALRYSLSSNDRVRKSAFIVSIGFPGLGVELGLIKALELAGFNSTVLTSRDPWLVKYYKLTGCTEILFWDEFARFVDPTSAEAVVDSLESFEDIMAYEHAGARVGRFAASTALRHLRLGTLDLQSPQIRQHLAQHIASGMKYAAAAKEIVHKVHPQIAVFVDRGYTPHGELFDVCLEDGVDVITWNTAHKSNSLMFKRYTLDNRDEHPASLSDDTWRWLCDMEWTDEHRQRLRQELYSTYASGDWYSEVGTQFNKRILDAAEIRKRLGLDPRKRTALIFPHILWDGTFFWGKDLFRNYEEWFIETVRTACANNQVNWIIKVHPANIVKNVRDGFQGESSEVVAIRKHIGQLPSHLFVIPADSNINTFSLFGLMAYCLTVRGTIGIEAASFGIPVLTAGTGRYDHKGFTIDSESRKQYVERLACIQEIPPLSSAQRELAERFAYGVFVLRPLGLTTVTLEFQRDAKATSKTRINVSTKEDWLNAPDLKALVRWLSDREQKDFLAFYPERVEHTETVGGNIP
ncbi:hypothetical protein MYX76_04120 [Desulfobacterota bacterium AH_259_B03_O07]|nr:hypothetical protein [Desulfobacterota bacterium AH_259_B03_O07]